tara:strand:- start:1092 stop:2135 length:1044 start_codon:yes stop_codon:yes gene_type:complete
MLKPYTLAQVTFEQIEEIGQDGQNSTTFRCHDHQLDAEIVVKKIPKDDLDQDAYFAEAQALYASSHPNVVQIHYACFDDDHVYVAMPYYQNGSLKGLMATKNLTVREIITIGCQVLSGLHNVHSKKLIHFDIKPDNVLLSQRGEALLSDFGLAKAIASNGMAEQDRFYLRMKSPEAFEGGYEFDPRFDVYQIGLLLYRMCNGNDEFNRQFSDFIDNGDFDRDGFSFAVRNGQFPDREIFLLHVPQSLRTVVKKCLHTDPAQRFQTALEVANALAKIDGSHLDWQYDEQEGCKIWKKNVKGTKYEFMLREDNSTECFKTVGEGQRRRFGKGCKISMTNRDLRTFLGQY